MSCVKINKSDGAKPPAFWLDSWEDLARSLSAFPPDVDLYGVHIDLKNAFWSFCLPPEARRIFRFRPAPGAPPVALSRLPFGWKYSPYLCQTRLARVLRGVLPPEILLVHYLDDFLLVFTDREVLREAGRSAVRALIEAGFLISPKSVLDPVPVASFLGKELNLATRQVRSHEQALLQFWVGWLRLAVGMGPDQHHQSFLGLLNWHVRPRGFGCPFAAGAYCWLRWGRTVGGVKQPAQGFPLKMLNSLATLTAVAAESWQAPGGEAWRQLKAFQFGKDDRLTSCSVQFFLCSACANKGPCTSTILSLLRDLAMLAMNRAWERRLWTTTTEHITAIMAVLVDRDPREEDISPPSDTSPKPKQRPGDPLPLHVAQKSIGAAGAIRIEPDTWRKHKPAGMDRALRVAPDMGDSDDAALAALAKAMHRDGLLIRCTGPPTANMRAFPKPKSADKGALIADLRLLNALMGSSPQPFELPSLT